MFLLGFVCVSRIWFFFHLIFIKLLRRFAFSRVEMVLSTFRRADRPRGNSSFCSMVSIAQGTILREIFIHSYISLTRCLFKDDKRVLSLSG